jgi:prolipoprotein diacylglyceryltransferase
MRWDAWDVFSSAMITAVPPMRGTAWPFRLRRFGVSVDPSIPDYQVLKVHPTQLYETAAALVMFAILMWLNKRPHRRGLAWGLFLIMLGIERFLVEIVRAKDDRFLGPFTVAQLISFLLVVAGLLVISLSRRFSLSRAAARDLR